MSILDANCQELKQRRNEPCRGRDLKTVSLEKLRENELISVSNLSEFTYPFVVL